MDQHRRPGSRSPEPWSDVDQQRRRPRNTVGAIGAVAGSTGEVSVTSGGQWENSSLLYIGGKTAGGSGSLVIASAEVSAADVTVWPLGAVTLDSGTIETNSLNLVGGARVRCGFAGIKWPVCQCRHRSARDCRSDCSLRGVATMSSQPTASWTSTSDGTTE